METRVYAGRIKDRAVLDYCSSGGAFTALSDVFLKNGDAVLCSGYNYDTYQTEFRMVFTAEERDTCRGSMYMQSIALNAWHEAEAWLKSNPQKKLIYFGVGCQGAAFRRFCEMRDLDDRVTIVDIICHGSPSPMIWKEYARSLEKNGKLYDINFRDKSTGWNNSIGVAKQNDKSISLSQWRRTYSSRVMLRPCCSVCPYTVVKRKTDITIGDFWHLEKSIPDFVDEKGTSVIIIHTEKGVRLFESAKENLDYLESNTKDCWQLNLSRPTEHADNRKNFWNDYKNKGIDYVMSKYGTLSFINRAKRKLKHVLKDIKN